MVESGNLKGGKLSHQLLFWFLCISLVPLMVVTLLVYRHSVQTIEDLVTYNLNAVGKRQSQEIQNFLEERERDVTLLAQNPEVAVVLQGGKREKLVRYFDYLKDSADYRDVILIDGKGRVLMSTSGRLKAPNLGTQELAQSNLGRVYEEATTLLSTSTSSFANHPELGDSTLFMASPVLDEKGLLGAVILEMAPAPIFGVVNDYAGLGSSGETTLVSRERDTLTFLTPTRHDSQAAGKTVSQGQDFLAAGVQGARKEGVTIDYRGQRVLAVLRYLPHLDAAIMIKIDESEALSPVNRLRNLALVVILATLVLVVAAAGYSARAVSEPLNRLTEGTEVVASGRLDHRLDIKADNEIGRLASSFNEMTARLKESIARLKETTETKERIESELQIAHDIQLSILPKIFPAFMHKPEFDAFATVVPAKEVGGDLYDFFLLEDNRLLVLIGDVSRKGVPAALFMAVTKTLFKATALGGVELQELMRKVNEELCRDNESGMFVTIFCAILDYQTGVVEYANAGHNPPYILRSDTIEALPKVKGMGMGVYDEATYETGSVALLEGDTLFLFTDGLTEAENTNQDFFTEARLQEFLKTQKTASPRTVVNQTLDTIREFADGAAQSDDITIMVVTYYGTKGGGGAQDNELSVTLRSDLEELTRLAEAVEAFGEYNNMPGKLLYQLNLALEELVSNVINYQSCRLIQIDVSFKPELLKVRLQDDGEEFNPFQEAPIPDLDLDIDEREIGGLGVHIVKTMFESHDYRRMGGRNFIYLTKDLT